MSSTKKAALSCAECPDRGPAFCDAGDLNKHYLHCHPGLAVFQCGQGNCSLQFFRKSSLIRHIGSAHEDVPAAAASFASETQRSFSKNYHDDYGNDGDEDGDVPPLPPAEEIQETPSEKPVDLTMVAAQVLLELRSTASLTGKSIERFQDGCVKILTNYRSHFICQISSLLKEKGLNESEIADIKSKIDEVENPFKNMKTIDDQLEFFHHMFGLVKPEPKFLDTRFDKRLNSETNSYIQTQVIECFQYISIIETLKAIIAVKTNRESIFKDHVSKDGILRSYMDGSHFRRHPFLQMHRHVIQIIIYYDELEVANPLGSRTIIHKLGVFFFQILNFPAQASTKLSSIYLLALVYADDMKKEGAFEKVLLPFIQEMKKLSSDEGVEIKVDGVPFILRAVLISMAADTLAAHDVLGFLGASARHFCRTCMISRNEFKENENSIGELRTSNSHDLQVEEVERFPRLSKQYGVKRKCPLNKVPFYHCVGGSVFDAFHDFLEGICPLVLKCVLRNIICIRKLTTIIDFNMKISSFDYGFPDSKNKPSPNFTLEMFNDGAKKLKQKGAQTWCLMRVLPFLVGHLVPVGDEHMKLVFLLQEIMKIIFSFEIRPADIDYLETLIMEHNSLYKSLYVTAVREEEQPNQQGENNEDEIVDDPPEDEGDSDEDRPQNLATQETNTRRKKTFKVNMINKMHHLVHYPDMIREMGPPVRMWCAKFEARMKIFRQHAAIVNCFKDIPQTMAKMFQLSNCSSFNAGTFSSIEFPRGEKNFATENDFPELYLEFGAPQELIKTRSVTVDGEQYRPGLFVCLPTPDSIQFLLISDIFIKEDTEVYLRAKPWTSNDLCPQYNAYHVSPDYNSQFVILKSSSLNYCHAIAPWVVHDGAVYLSVRTLVL